MKKTLTVNISGIVFHIDEDAYNVLNDYLQSIRQHFSRTEGRDEIVSDIEARIAEMLKDRIGDARQVITIDDIEEVIRVIGLPNEFGEEFSESSGPGSSGETGKAPKRLYRDPENAVLGGVCGGMGAYFHADPVWFRLAFVILCIPGIGTPLLVYAVLWIVIPEARTAAERLEMKGERVNISNIEKSIKEEIGNLKNKFNEFTSQAKRTYKKKSAAHRSDFQGVENAFTRIAELFVRVVLIFIGFILTIIGISFLVSILVLIFGFGLDVFVFDSEVINISLRQASEIFVGPPATNIIFQLSLLLTLGIPVALLIYAGVKLMLGINRTNHVGLTAFYVWLVSFIICIFYGFNIVRDFSHKNVNKEKIQVEMPANNVLNVMADTDGDFNHIYNYGDYLEIDGSNFIITNNKHLLYGIPQVSFEYSTKSNAEIDIISEARGKSDLHAADRAGRTIYHYSISDGNIILDPCFTLPDKEVWREQEVNVIIKVPEGTILNLNENLRRIINSHMHSPYRLAGSTWVMTSHGLEESESNQVIPDIKPVEQNQPQKTNEQKNDSLVFNLTRNIMDVFCMVVPGI